MSQSSKTALGLQSIARFYLARAREQLWLKPMMSCLLSMGAVLVAGSADGFLPAEAVAEVSPESLETVLSIMSASMLVIAMFAVGAMLSAYASASSSATPRAFPLVVADDVSQNALSTFLGAFIFSIVGLVAHLNSYYGSAGRFVLFVITLLVFAVVVLAFVRWVDRIARLGRLGYTVDKVEKAADAALQSWAHLPTLSHLPAGAGEAGPAVFSDQIGYVQNINLEKLQCVAEQIDALVSVSAIPGRFISPNIPLVTFSARQADAAAIAPDEAIAESVRAAFVIGGERTFESDPRFGLVVMSEIASRALSPAVNDPGTAIDIISSLLRLLVRWSRAADEERPEPAFDRVVVPTLSWRAAFDNAFKAIARDGAGSLEVALRLQKAYLALAEFGDEECRGVAIEHSQLALRYARGQLQLAEEVDAVAELAQQLVDSEVSP